MSEIEETLERIKGHAGVEAYVIISNEGEVLRKLPGMPTEKAKDYGDEVMKLARKARHVVRDLDPKVRTACNAVGAALGERFRCVPWCSR